MDKCGIVWYNRYRPTDSRGIISVKGTYVMGKIKFTKVNDDVYFLKTPFGKQWYGIVLIKGKTPETTVLIDTGANDEAVTKYLVPALKNLRMSPRHVGTVLFTHFHAENIGGVSALRRENPRIKVIVPRGYRETILNPMVSIMAMRDRFSEYNSHHHEIRGVYPDRELTEAEECGGENVVGLNAIRVSGHADGFCWYHTDTKTLICGDLLQGNGHKDLGRPYYTDLDGYRETIERLKKLDDIKYMVSACELDGLPDMIVGRDAFREALGRCEECVYEMDRAIRQLLRQGVTDVAEIAEKISVEYTGTVPEGLTYVMQSVSEHIDDIRAQEQRKEEERKKAEQIRSASAEDQE